MTDQVHSWPGGDFTPWRSPCAALAHHRGDDPWLIAVAHDGIETVLTYGMADVASRSIAALLTAELNGHRDTLAVAPTNDIPSVLAVLGALRAGFSLLMLGPADPPERRARQLEAVGAVMMPRIPDWRSALVDPRVDPRAEQWSDPEIDPDADALMFATSGSTAVSKLVVQTHRNAVANAEALRLHHNLSAGDRVLGCLPIHHVNGLHFTVLGTMLAGAQTVLAESFSPLTYPALLKRYRPRIASVVPSVLETLMETWRRPELPEGFDYFVSAAAPLSAGTARTVADRLGARVLQGYGLSETTNFATTMPPGLSEADYRRLMLDADIPSVGVALPGNEVAVLDENCAKVPAGQVGEVCMRGLNVMARYAGNETATAEAFRGGWFHSQDLGYQVEVDGREFLVLTGRLKNIAKVGGETVSLDEMDRVLRALPCVKDAACVAIPDRFAGERIVAAVVLTDGVDSATLTEPLRATFPKAVLPDRFVTLLRIPRTATGKVLRPQLASELS